MNAHARTSSRIALLLAAGFAQAGCLPSEADRDGVWRAGIAPMPNAKYSPAGGVVGGEVFVIGGPTGEGDGRFHRYDPVDNTWNPRSILTGTYWYAATVLDGTLYACGADEALFTMTCFSYDPATNDWTEIATRSGYRAGFAMAGVQGQLFLSGGLNPANGTGGNTVDVLDPVTGVWTSILSMPHRTQRHAMVESGGRLYVFGADDFTQAPFAIVYDFAAGAWHEVTDPMPADLATGQRSAAVLGERILLAGDSGRLYAFLPATERWKSAGQVPSPRANPCVVSDGASVYVIGGFDPANPSEPLPTMEVLVP